MKKIILCFVFLCYTLYAQTYEKIDVSQIKKDYENNPYRTETQYVGKQVEITSFVRSIDKPQINRICLRLENSITGMSIYCRLQSEDIFDKILPLDKHDSITIRGVITEIERRNISIDLHDILDIQKFVPTPNVILDRKFLGTWLYTGYEDKITIYKNSKDVEIYNAEIIFKYTFLENGIVRSNTTIKSNGDVVELIDLQYRLKAKDNKYYYSIISSYNDEESPIDTWREFNLEYIDDKQIKIDKMIYTKVE